MVPEADACRRLSIAETSLQWACYWRASQARLRLCNFKLKKKKNDRGWSAASSTLTNTASVFSTVHQQCTFYRSMHMQQFACMYALPACASI